MDNCLKDTLIDLMRHYLSPKTQILKFSQPPSNTYEAENWQRTHFEDMFNLLKDNLNTGGRNLILNRAHLGEYVYSPIYRNYNADWVFQLEEAFLNDCQNYQEMIRLIVLYDSNNSQLIQREDGKSLSKAKQSKLNLERQNFLEAFRKSKIQDKFLFDLSDYVIDPKDRVAKINLEVICDEIFKT